MLSKINNLIKKFNKIENIKVQFPISEKIIHLDRLEKNIQEIKKNFLKNEEKILIPVKANAYGHGLIPVSKFLEEKKLVNYFGTAHLEEARILRKNKIKTNILVLSQPLFNKKSIDFIIKNNIEISISDFDFLNQVSDYLKNSKKKIKIHLMIDTGMGREGILVNNLKEKDFQKILGSKNIELIGVYTHFSVSDENKKSSVKFTELQIEKFTKVKKQIEKIFGNKKIIFHSANSGAILSNEKAIFDMIRPGILTYGYSDNLTIDVKPVLELKTKITLIKKYPSKSYIGYGQTYQTKKEESIGIIPIGYGDGLPRTGSNKFKFIVNDKFAKVLGRISMDQTSISIDKNIKVGDEVILIGESGDKMVSADDLAGFSNTISYEILTGFGDQQRIRSVYK